MVGPMLPLDKGMYQLVYGENHPIFFPGIIVFWPLGTELMVFL